MLVFAVVVALLCAVTPFAVRYAKMGAQRMYASRLYRECAAHALPATTPAWEEDPRAVKQLRDTSPHYALVGSHHGEAAYLVPERWRQLNAELGQQIQSWGTLFLHERRTPASNKPRLVGVDIAGWSRGGPVILFARVRTFSPPAPFRLPQEEKVDHPSVRLSAAEGVVRILAGQADPNDPSHFTIDFAVGDQRGMLDGWLKEDGSVVLESHGLP